MIKSMQHCDMTLSCVGLAVRMPSTFLVMWGGGFTWKERLFFAFAWTPKVFPFTFLQPSVTCAVHTAVLVSCMQIPAVWFG